MKLIERKKLRTGLCFYTPKKTIHVRVSIELLLLKTLVRILVILFGIVLPLVKFERKEADGDGCKTHDQA